MPGEVCVGVGVIVLDEFNRRVLLGKRKGAHGSGTWALPGGWLEKGEEFVFAGLRELQEETGLTTADLAPDANTVVPFVSNNIMPEGVHSVTVYVRCALREPTAAARVQVCEPDKCFEWAWHDYSAAPEPRFIPLSALLQSEYWCDEVVATARGRASSQRILLAAALAAVSIAIMRAAVSKH